MIARRLGFTIELVPHLFATGANRPIGLFGYARLSSVPRRAADRQVGRRPAEGLDTDWTQKDTKPRETMQTSEGWKLTSSRVFDRFPVTA